MRHVYICPICAQTSDSDWCRCGFKRPVHPITLVRESIKGRINALLNANEKITKAHDLLPMAISDEGQSGMMQAYNDHTSQITAFFTALDYINDEFGEES